MARTFGRTVSGLTAAAMLLASVGPLVAPAAAATPDAAAAAVVDACRVDNEERFRAEVDRLTLEALKKGLADVDYKSVVREVWRKQELNARLDAQVDKSIAQITEETSWGAILQSLASQEAAEKLAAAVAERTYQSDEMKSAVEDLAGAVGDQLAGRIELAALDAALPAIGCVRAYLGGKYGSAIALMVADDTGKQFEGTATAGAAGIGTGDVAIRSEGIVAGTVVLIVRRTLSGMAKRLGKRVVGAVVSKVVSVVAGGIGVVLIAKDLWDMRNGVLPIIEEEMKSEESKERVQAEIATAISEQLNTHLSEVSAKTAERIVAVWHEFRQAHAAVVGLTERAPVFKSFIDGLDRKDLPKVDRVVAMVSEREGEAGVLARAENGTLRQAVSDIPAAALEIAMDNRSLEDGLGWHRLAGSAVERVHALDLHRKAPPQSFTPAIFKQMMALNNDQAIVRLAALPGPSREVLLGLTPERTIALTRALPQEELASFAGYLGGLSRNAGVRLMSAIADDPQRMKLFASPRVQAAVLASRDQEGAVGMLLRPGSLFDIAILQEDGTRVWRGDVAPILMWERHGLTVGVLGALALFVLLLLWRMLPGGRRR